MLVIELHKKSLKCPYSKSIVCTYTYAPLVVCKIVKSFDSSFSSQFCETSYPLVSLLPRNQRELSVCEDEYLNILASLSKIQIIMGVKCYNFSIKEEGKKEKKREQWFFYKNAIFNTERWHYSSPPLSVEDIVQDTTGCLKLQIIPNPRYPICFPIHTCHDII